MGGPELHNPTGYIVSECNKLGAAGSKVGHEKLGKTITWWNKYGGLEADGKPIKYLDVIEPLSRLMAPKAMSVLHQLGEKKDQIKDPTAWIIGHVRKLEQQGEAWPS